MLNTDDASLAALYRADIGYDLPLVERAALTRHLSQGAPVITVVVRRPSC